MVIEITFRGKFVDFYHNEVFEIKLGGVRIKEGKRKPE